MAASLFTDVPLVYTNSMSAPALVRINSSSRPYFVTRRRLLDKWFGRYPIQGRAKLNGAFKEMFGGTEAIIAEKQAEIALEERKFD